MNNLNHIRHHLYSLLGKCEYCIKANVYIVINAYLTPPKSFPLQNAQVQMWLVWLVSCLSGSRNNIIHEQVDRESWSLVTGEKADWKTTKQTAQHLRHVAIKMLAPKLNLFIHSPTDYMPSLSPIHVSLRQHGSTGYAATPQVHPMAV